jgi:hypothetical protein
MTRNIRADADATSLMAKSVIPNHSTLRIISILY